MVIWHFMENNGHRLLPTTKFELSQEFEFWTLVSDTQYTSRYFLTLKALSKIGSGVAKCALDII